MAITATMVKELRETTGAGMMDCKNALKEADGDMEAAVDWLRKKGLSKAAKKAGRVASEGLIGVAQGENSAAIVEVNSETDFVARNEQFQTLVSTIAQTAVSVGGDIEKLKSAPYPGSEKTVEDEMTSAIATIGENMSLRRSSSLSVSNGVVSTYMHNSAAPGLGKIGVLVALESDGDKSALDALGRQIAMHVAATNPLALSTEELDAEIVDRERQVYADQARASGKPDNIIEKMVEGRLRKYYQEVVLLQQAFVIDPDKTVEAAVKDAESSAGGAVKVTGFIRMEIGEGIEKEEADFAAEVAATAGTS